MRNGTGRETVVLLIYIVYSIISDATLLRTMNDSFILALLSLFTIIEYTAFAYILYTLIGNKTFKKFIIWVSCPFYAYAIIRYFTASTYSFDSLPASMEAILVISFSVYYLFEQLNKPEVIFVYQSRFFWFVTGFIIYLSGTLFLFIVANELPKNIRFDSWDINLVLTIVKNILFSIGFLFSQQSDQKIAEEESFS